MTEFGSSSQQRLRKAALIAEGIMGKQASDDDPLAYWTLIMTLLEFADPHASRVRAPQTREEET